MTHLVFRLVYHLPQKHTVLPPLFYQKRMIVWFQNCLDFFHENYLLSRSMNTRILWKLIFSSPSKDQQGKFLLVNYHGQKDKSYFILSGFTWLFSDTFCHSEKTTEVHLDFFLSDCFSCVYVCAPYTPLVPSEMRRGYLSPRTKVTPDSEKDAGYWISVLSKNTYMLLSAKPSLQQLSSLSWLRLWII